MNKPHFLVENFGENVRVTLKEGQNGMAHIAIANLAWACKHRHRDGEEIESFITSPEKLASAVKTFRCINTTQPRRGSGLFKQSPFVFEYIPQQAKNHNTYKPCNNPEFKVGFLSILAQNGEDYE